MLCDKTKQCIADILTPHARAITLVFWHQQWLRVTPPFVWNLRSKWPTPFQTRRLRQTFTYNVSTVRDSEKSSITMNRKSMTGFPTSCIWSAYINHKSPKGWLRSDFLFIHMFIQHKSDTSRVIIKFGDVDCAIALYALCCWIHSNCFVNM